MPDEALRRRLFDAFAARPRPTAEQIVRQDDIDDFLALGRVRVREALAERAVGDVSIEDANKLFEGNLWMLSPGAFLYYLPALMWICLASYGSVSVLAYELVGALTLKSRDDILASLDRLMELPPPALRDQVFVDAIRRQQLEWFDSGDPTNTFHERFDEVTRAEGSAVLAFLEAFRDRFAEGFQFGELDAAIDRLWVRFRSEALPDDPGPG
jgi:hypothetical protein